MQGKTDKARNTDREREGGACAVGSVSMTCKISRNKWKKQIQLQLHSTELLYQSVIQRLRIPNAISAPLTEVSFVFNVCMCVCISSRCICMCECGVVRNLLGSKMEQINGRCLQTPFCPASPIVHIFRLLLFYLLYNVLAQFTVFAVSFLFFYIYSIYLLYTRTAWIQNTQSTQRPKSESTRTQLVRLITTYR